MWWLQCKFLFLLNNMWTTAKRLADDVYGQPTFEDVKAMLEDADPCTYWLLDDELGVPDQCGPRTYYEMVELHEEVTSTGVRCGPWYETSHVTEDGILQRTLHTNRLNPRTLEFVNPGQLACMYPNHIPTNIRVRDTWFETINP